MNNLKDLNCTPLSSESVRLGDAEIKEYLIDIPLWHLIEKEGIQRLERTYQFKNFTDALAFTSHVGETAEMQDHHPSILTEWGKVTINWWTHKVKGLHLNDFIMAARSDKIYTSQGQP